MSALKPSAASSTEAGHPPTLLDGTPYRFIAPLGHGAMGDVVEAEHVALGKRVVVKLLQERHANRPDYIDRMRIEAQALAKITHPNLVQVTDFGQTATGRTFLVMERLRGKNLREELEQREFIPVLEAMNIVRQSLQGLAATHDAGIVHRDVKLENLFLCETNTGRRLVKLLDFGVAKVIGVAGDNTPLPLAFPTAEGVAMGTPRYFSPEQARGRDVDWRTDVYAAGIVLYTLVAGRGPFDHHTTLLELTRAHAFEPPDPPSKLAPQPIPPELDAAILKALAKEPLDRFPTALAFAVELERVSAKLNAEQRQQGASVPPPPETPQLEPSTRPAAKLPQPTAPDSEDEELQATLLKVNVRRNAAGNIVASAPASSPPVSSEPEPPTVRVDANAVAAAVKSVTGEDDEAVITQRIAAPMLMKLRQTTAEQPVPSQPEPITKPRAQVIPAAARPDKPGPDKRDDRPRDSASFDDLEGPVPTDPSAGQLSIEPPADTPLTAGAQAADQAPPSIPIVAPGTLAKGDADENAVNESRERAVSFAARAAEHASTTGRGDRISALPGRKDRISALPGRSPSALPGRKDRISALPGRPADRTTPAPKAPETDEPKAKPAPTQTPAQVHIPGPKNEDKDNAQGVRPMKAPVPWRVRRTAPGAARVPTVAQKAGDEPKQDNTKLYYTIALMIAVIAAATFFILSRTK